MSDRSTEPKPHGQAQRIEVFLGGAASGKRGHGDLGRTVHEAGEPPLELDGSLTGTGNVGVTGAVAIQGLPCRREPDHEFDDNARRVPNQSLPTTSVALRR